MPGNRLSSQATDNGNDRWNTAPPSVSFSAQIRPWCAKTMVRAMERPIPMPCSLVVKNGSKIWVSLSGGIPGDRNYSRLFPVQFRATDHSPSVGYRSQRTHAVHDQVDDHLLQLNPIALHPYHFRGCLQVYLDFSCCCVHREKIKDFAHKLVEIDISSLERRPFHETAQ